MDRDDEYILKAFQRGDSAAVREVMGWARAEVSRLSRNRPALRTCLEDRVQDALIKLLDRPKNSEKTPPRLQLRRAAERICLDWLRSTHRERAERFGGIEGLGENDRELAEYQGEEPPPEKIFGERREQLIGRLEITLQYIDLAYRIRAAYQRDTKRFQQTIIPLLEAKLRLLEMRKSVFVLVLRGPLPLGDEEKTRTFGPLLLTVQDSLQKLDEDIKSKMRALSWSSEAEAPDEPFEFSEFLGDVINIRLRPATLIFRVWSKIVKKPGGRYADYDLMCQYFDELQCRHRGTDKAYLFSGSFEPKSLRIEAFKNSKMKVFYDRLATWISQKAVIDRRSLEEEIAFEDRHIPENELGELRAAAARDSGGRREG